MNKLGEWFTHIALEVAQFLPGGYNGNMKNNRVQEILPYFKHEHPLRLAHRGSTLLWPENTMTAFQGAAGMNCIYIETDLHMTRDGILVTFHDDRLERLTNGRGRVKDWDWQDLRRLDAAYHFKPAEGFPLRGKGITIPSLEAAMVTFPHLMFNLDLKQPGIEQATAAFIARHHFEDRVLIASFAHHRIRRFGQFSSKKTATSAGTSKAVISWALSRFNSREPGRGSSGVSTKNLKKEVDALQLPHRFTGKIIIDQKLIRWAHQRGLQVHAWVVNDPEEMRQLIEMGIDGIVTDRIDLLNAILK